MFCCLFNLFFSSVKRKIQSMKSSAGCLRGVQVTFRTVRQYSNASRCGLKDLVSLSAYRRNHHAIDKGYVLGTLAKVPIRREIEEVATRCHKKRASAPFRAAIFGFGSSKENVIVADCMSPPRQWRLERFFCVFRMEKTGESPQSWGNTKDYRKV